MGREHWSAAVAAAALLCACGGDEFSEGSGTGGQSSGGVGASGGSASGGTAGTASGGSGGASGGSGGASGSGGSGGAPPGCGNAHPSAALLYTTLDDPTAITSPAVIKNGTGTVKNGSFVAGFCSGKAFQVGAVGAYAKYLAPQNVSLGKGTLDFHFKPSFDKNDGKGHRLIGVPGLMQLAKTAQNQLIFGIGSTPIAAVASSDLKLVQNQWVRITVTWNTSLAQIAQIYFDGALAPLANSATGPVTPPTLAGELWIGAFAASDADFANGVFDDLKVYDDPQPP